MPFRIALSGLNSASNDLKVTGNNIANASTTGFKRSRAEFVDVYAAAYGAIAATTPGNGVRTSNIRQLFSQGNVEYTDNATDLAVTGQGFFVVADDKGRFLTRNGAFGLDRDGFVQNSTGQRLQIFPSVTVGNVTTYNTGSLVDLQLSNTIGAPEATTKVNVNVNLDADVINKQDVNGMGATLYDPLWPAGSGNEDFNPAAGVTFDETDPTTYNHVTATTTYDTLGAPHVLTMYWRKLEDSSATLPLNNTWQTYAFVDGQPMQPSSDPYNAVAPGPGPATVPPLAVGTREMSPAVLNFGVDGTMQTAEYWSNVAPLGRQLSANNSVIYEPMPTTTGSAPVQISIDFSDLTQFGSDFAVNELNQDGFTTGRLAGFDVEEDGVVFSRYTNGNKEVMGMVAMANVPNPQGLAKRGDSLWSEAFDAGDTVLGQPGTSNFGLIQAGALEGSTVELADELVQMIIAQRNYQANSQVISTADQITQTLLNIR